MSNTNDILRHLVDKNLSLFLFDTAIFYAERLHCNKSSLENLHILAECYYRKGKTKQTYLILQHSTLSESRYLFAQVCYTLNKYRESEQALLSTLQQSKTQTLGIYIIFDFYITINKLIISFFLSINQYILLLLLLDQLKQIPGGAAGVHLLGLICRREHRKSAAIDYFKKSLEIEPTLWSSITELCELGVHFDTKEIFGLSFEKSINYLHSNESNEEEMENVILHQQQQESSTSSTNKENTPSNINSVLLNRQLAESLSGFGSPKSSM
jgi:tetratricopeptide (TPR) repeat protein